MKLTGDELLKLGAHASFVFLTENKPLDEVIVKLAADNDLNPEQVKRVCHSANQATMLSIYQNGDNTREFKVASADEVISKMNLPKQPESPVSKDYLDNPCSDICSEVKTASFTPDNHMDKVRAREKRIILEKEAARLVYQLKDAEQNVFMEYHKYSSAVDALYEVVKQAILGGHKIEDLLQAALQAMPDNGPAVQGIFSEIMERLKNDPSIAAAANAGMGPQVDEAPEAQEEGPGFLSGLWEGAKGIGSGISNLFKGGEAVEEALISKDMSKFSKDVPIKIINGRHPIVKTICSVIDKRKSINRADRLARNIKDKLTVVTDESAKLKDQEGEWF